MKNIQRLRNKRQLFFVYYLIAIICYPAVLTAQNGVTVSGLEMDAGTVTFSVSWKNTGMPTPWSASVWVFVDYNDAGTMKRLPLLPGATLTETSAPGVGEVIEESGNNQGVWVVGNARSAGSFSATVQLLTATATGACAYASNYPPVGEYTAASAISFIGTPMYEIVLKETFSGNTYTTYSKGVYSIPEGSTFVSFTDATAAPGIIHCFPPAAPTVVTAAFCYGLPGQLQASTSGGATIAWYDAPTEGNLLYTGNVLPLTPLYNDAAHYYAQAVSESSCVSARIQANYTVNHCVINGYCPGFTAGSVGSATAPVPEAACSTYDSGLIGLTNYQAACGTTYYPGQIGPANYPAACVSYDAGYIGRSQ
jgi:hypothetical protein